jgi:hypothetical protein
MACLRLVTRPPLPPFPLRSVPRFRRRRALATSRLALGLYLRLLVRRAMSIPPVSNECASLPCWKLQSTCRRKVADFCSEIGTTCALCSAMSVATTR